MKKIVTLLVFLSITTTALGQCMNGDCENGTGLYKGSRYVYEGQFKNGIPHGNGRLAKENGDLYQGSFEYGMYNGTGTFYGADNTVYTGSFHQGVKQGKGSMYYPDGKKYEGLFRNDKPQTDKAAPNDLPFYSGNFRIHQFNCEAVFAKIDLENNVVITQNYEEQSKLAYPAVFDLSTGAFLPQEVNWVATGILPENYHEYFVATNQKKYSKSALMLDFYKNFPKESKDRSLSQTFGARDIPGTDYYIINVSISVDQKKTRDPGYEIRCYKLYADGKVKKVSDNPDAVGEVLAVSPDGSCIATYNHRSKVYEIFGNYLKKSVVFDAIPSDTKQEVFSNPKTWFSVKNDSLYHLSKGMLLSVYNAATGKLVRSKQYSNNRISEGRLEFAVVTGNQLKCVVTSDAFVSNVYMSTSDAVHYETTAAPHHRKAYILDLEDPDYLLPLVNPLFKEEYYVAKTQEAKNNYSAWKLKYEEEKRAEREKYQEKLKQRGITGLLEDDDYQPVTAVSKKRTYLTKEVMDNLIQSNAAPVQSGESGWDKLFREREKQFSRDYQKLNERSRGY